MRILLDENVPKKLKYRLAPEHEAWTVVECGWSGMLNGELLHTAEARFDVFLTMDRGIEYQQDLVGLALRVVVLKAVNNTYDMLLPLVPEIKRVLPHLQAGAVAHIM